MNAKANTSVTVKISKDLKNNAQDVLNDIGMTMSGAITVFLTQLVNDNGLPFRPQRTFLNDPESIKARQDVENDHNLTKVNSLNELWKSLDSDD